MPAIPFAFVFGVVVANAGIPEWLGWSSSPIIF
ncbi:MAG: branched-chain amino acid permease, partial [Halieaceae bacterium]|nr:branched-chain amino acid permease [Halieaceae bacterium]